MIYLRNIFTQDLRDGKQIAFPTEPSNIFFKFNFRNPDPDRKICFKFKEKDSSSSDFQYNDKVINTRLYAAGSESRIDGELKQFLRDDLRAKIEDIIVFRALAESTYEFELIRKDSNLYDSFKELLNSKNHEVILEHFAENLSNENNPSEILCLTNLKEEFATWFIKLDDVKHYFSDSFGASRDKLIEQLSKYESIYEDQFGTLVFDFQGMDPNEFIAKLTENLYIESGDFYEFSAKTSNHMPRAILGKKNYLKFLHERIVEGDRQFDYREFHNAAKSAGLIFSEQIIQRFIASLCTKPFVICTGLSGSGKTKLSQAFAKWISADKSQYVIVPVGADWTNREPLLGYSNAINIIEYVSPENGVLELLLKAYEEYKIYLSDKTRIPKPYFLILDEMNLSHVERYFADFLSTMESGDEISLHKIINETKGIPNSITLPKNFFIIGTVNIDETTYMFSPKVLDRANTLEFRLTEGDLDAYINNNIKLNLETLTSQGAYMSDGFVNLALEENENNLKDNSDNLKLFFSELKKAGAEFGYRSANEIGRLMMILEKLGVSKNSLLDIAIMQKLLPKLHGSRNKLTKILPVLGSFCLINSDRIKENYFEKFVNNSLTEQEFQNDSNIKYIISFEKICRMYKNAVDNGYASYAEA